MDTKEYFEMLEKARKGLISPIEWQDYCAEKLKEIMLENIEIFKRLKDR